jgi:hypothetical protein
MNDPGIDPVADHIPTDISWTTFSWVGTSETLVFLGDSDVGGIIVGMIFGALYCLAWNHSFYSAWERRVWRGCSLTITGSLIPYAVVNAICTIRYQKGVKQKKTHIVHVLSLYTILAVYAICRIIMLVMMVRTLFL